MQRLPLEGFANKILQSIKSRFGEKQFDIICFGIGDFFNSFPSACQLAVLSLLRKDPNVVDCKLHDPILLQYSEIHSFLRKFSVNFIEKNTECKHEIIRETFFFMPHCSKGMYNNVLFSNWEMERLKRITIYGNDLSSYEMFEEVKEDSCIKKVSIFG